MCRAVPAGRHPSESDLHDPSGIGAAECSIATSHPSATRVQLVLFSTLSQRSVTIFPPMRRQILSPTSALPSGWRQRQGVTGFGPVQPFSAGSAWASGAARRRAIESASGLMPEA